LHVRIAPLRDGVTNGRAPDTQTEMDAGSHARQERFDRLFAAHYSAVLAYALRRVPRALAEDAVSETFLAAWRRLDELPADSAPWLYGTARRMLANQRRSARRREALLHRLTHFGRDPAPTLLQVSDGRVSAALAELPEREREAVLLVAWEGLSPARAAVAAGCSPDALRQRLHRGRRRLARALADHHPSAAQACAAAADRRAS
jgi:RNA polymerase sigma-70 factor, ECF subfamily